MENGIALTIATQNLFRALVMDAPNWNGSPLFDGSKEERGNLTHLKKEGLVISFVSDGDVWVHFTQKGVDLARSLYGVDLAGYGVTV